MSSQSTRLIASSDKYWLQQIANNTAITGNTDIQKLPPTNKQDTLQSVGIFGNDDTGKWQSLKVSSDGTASVNATITNEVDKQLNVAVENDSLLGNGQILYGSSSWTGVKADSTGTFSADPNDRPGVYYTNTVAGDKANLYYFDGTQETLTVADLSSVYATVYIDDITIGNIPHLIVYTKPTGVGDVAPWYHSSKTWEYDPNNTDKIGIGERIIICGENRPSKYYSEQKVLYDLSIVSGDFLDTEEILTIALHTNTASPAGGVKVCVNSLGFNGVGGLPIRDYELVQPDSVQVGLATEAKQDTMISRLQAIEDETQANGISLSSIETDTEIIKNTQATLLSTNQQILVDTTTIVASQDDILNELVGIGESTGKISKGEDTSIASGAGGLQQILCYGMDNQNNLEPINIDPSGHLKITINDVDETNIGLKIAGETGGGNQVNLKVGNSGNLRTHESLERINTTQTLTIPDTQTVNSNGIDMSDYQYLAIFGDTNNTFNKNIFLEYSTDNITYYRGAGDNSKIIVVGASGNFFDQERIITKWVRISRPNTSGASETMNVNFTRA